MDYLNVNSDGCPIVDTLQEKGSDMFNSELDHLLNQLLKALGCTEDKTYQIGKFMLADLQLFDMKQRDYGENNISKCGEFGVLVRASDKLERLTTLLDSGRLPSNESVEDSWQDLALYSTIARAVRNGTW